MAFLPPELRNRLACSTASILAMSPLLEAIDAEVALTFQEHPTLPQTEQARRILWALVFPKFSEPAAKPKNQQAA